MPLWALLGCTAWSQAPATPQRREFLFRLRETPWSKDLIYEARSTGQVQEAKSVINQRLDVLACELPDSMKTVIECVATASALQIVDPVEGAGEAILVRWVEAFLKLSNRPSSDEVSPGEFSPAYREWCRKQGWSAENALAREVACNLYIRALAQMGDAKLRPLFRRGIASDSYSIVSASTYGSALLKDKEVLPGILSAIKRRSAFKEYEFLFMELRHFDDPEVDRLIRAGVADKELGESILNMKPIKANPEFKP